VSLIAEADVDGGGASGLIAGLVVLLVVGLVVCAFIGKAIGDTKGRGGLGFVLGLVFGVVGLVVIALIHPTVEAQARRDRDLAAAAQASGTSSRLRPCPWCAELIQPAARICRYCGRDVQTENGMSGPSPGAREASRAPCLGAPLCRCPDAIPAVALRAS
jgi:hypothetical protein